MVNIPTTDRQFYDTTKKVNTLATFSGALQPAAENLRKTLVEQQNIRIETNATKGRAEADEFVRGLQLKYQRTPNSPEYKSELKEGLNNIWKKYGQDIDPLMQGQWGQMTNKLNLAYDTASNDWAWKQRQENAKLDLADGMNANYNLAYSHGKSNNIEAAILDLDYSYNKMKESVTSSLGEMEAHKLLKDYKKQFIKNFIDGQLQTNPEAALTSLNNKDIARVFDNTKEADDMKQYAVAKLDTLKKQAKYRNILSGIQQGNGLINKSMQQTLSLEEIESLMPKDATDDYKRLIYSLNGYGSTKGGTKLSDAGKALETSELYEQMSMLLSNKNGASVDDFNKFQNNVYKAMANKSLSKEEGMKIINEIADPMAKAWDGIGEKLSDGGGWFSGRDAVGAEGVIKTLKDNKILGKVDIKSKDKKTKAALEAANSKIKVKAYQYFYDELQKQVDNSGGKYGSIIDVMNETNIADKREILQKAQDAALHDMASDQFGYLANYKEEAQPNKVLADSGMTPNTNNVKNSTLGTPVKQSLIVQVGTSGGKYVARMSDGSIREISQTTYQQYRK